MTEPLLATEAEQTTEGLTETPPPDSLSVDGKEKSQETQESTTETEETTEEVKPEGAPESYEFANPEGIPNEIEGDSEIHDAYSKAARELNLPQDQAQTLYDTTMTAVYERHMDALETQAKEWTKAAETDSEYGGSNFEENKGTALKAVKEFGSDGLREMLSEPNGIGNNPEIIRLLFRVGTAVSGDRFVGSNEGATIDPTDDAALARKLYPSEAK